MKTTTLLLLGLSLVGAASASRGQTPGSTIVPFGDVAPGYTYAWGDEFDGNALDASQWTYRTDSKMWSTQLPDNVSVADGKLSIALKKQQNQKYGYTGGGIITKRPFEYGYYEARFKVPPGSGWHTSFWAMAYNDKNTAPQRTQEIDFCEQDSVITTKYSAGVIAWDQRGKDYGRKYVHTPDLAADFHVWGCEFTPTHVRFFFDGKLTHETDAAKFAHGPQNIWLTCIASPLGGTKSVADNKLPATAEFDYVRYFAPPAAPAAIQGK